MESILVMVLVGCGYFAGGMVLGWFMEKRPMLVWLLPLAVILSGALLMLGFQLAFSLLIVVLWFVYSIVAFLGVLFLFYRSMDALDKVESDMDR